MKMRIPFGTIHITNDSKKRVMECLEKGRVSSGRLVNQFEERFAQLMETTEAVAVSSGTDALMLALAVLYDCGAQRGDEIILPALSFVATGNAVVHAGFRPVFVDVEPGSFNMDVRRIESVVSPRTRAILPVHLMGKPAEMDTITAIARKHDLLVIEDAAEAFGGMYKGRKLGTIGHMGAFSLYVAHIISTVEGGIVVTGNPDYGETLRSLRAHGRACKCRKCVSNITSGYCEKRFADKTIGDIRFHFERIGYSAKMNELEAAVGLGNLDQYDHIVDKRHQNLMHMIEGMAQFSAHLWTFAEAPYERIGPHAFPFVVKDGAPFTRDELIVYLEKKGIDARTLFASIPTQCGGYEFLGYRPGDFPEAENIGRNGIHMGVHQDITREDIQWFFKCLDEFIRNY